MKWLCCIPVLLTLVGGGKLPHPLVAPTGQPTITLESFLSRSNCQSSYDGIVYCVEDRGDMHVIIIDLENPHIRFEMVMADDVTSVNTNRREQIEDMIAREPYEEQNVVVAINADYFGQYHGPEGLTVKNGQRLDTQDVRNENPHAVWRSSLAISRLNHVTMGRKTVEELATPGVYHEHFYNAIGGGPLILNYGIVIPNVVACVLERFPLGACERRIQTAAGLSEDGRWLYLAVGEGRDIQGFAELLRDYGAFTAIKLDGGGSSQLWYNGRMRHDTRRAVGNALFVFYNSIPRHDAEIRGLSQAFVVESGQLVEIGFEIQNTGFLDWEPHLGYRFKNVQGWPVIGGAYQRLPQRVPVGETLSTSLDIIAPYTPGVYETQWQLTLRSEPIGPRLWFSLIVLPPEAMESGLKEQIETQITEWLSSPQSESQWPALLQALEQTIRREVEQELRLAVCDKRGWIETFDGAPLWARWATWLLALAC